MDVHDLMQQCNGKTAPSKACGGSSEGFAVTSTERVLAKSLSAVRLSSILLAVSSWTGGCSKADLHPDKWYLMAYDNGKFIIQHDHKVYTAECFQSFSVGSKNPDRKPDCTDLLTVPGVGNELPEKVGKDSAWVALAEWAIFTPAGDEGPQYQLKFVSIKQKPSSLSF
jgi:hypothetical protein